MSEHNAKKLISFKNLAVMGAAQDEYLTFCRGDRIDEHELRLEARPRYRTVGAKEMVSSIIIGSNASIRVEAVKEALSHEHPYPDLFTQYGVDAVQMAVENVRAALAEAP